MSRFMRLAGWRTLLIFAVSLPAATGAAQAVIDPATVSIVAGRPNASGGDVGQYASFTQDASGGQHIAYYDATFRRIKYAHRASPGAEWTAQSISSNTLAGEHASIAVGSVRQVNATCMVFNTSTLVTVTSGVTLSPLLVGARFQANFSGFYRVVAVDEANQRVTLDAPFSGATDPEAPSLFEFYQPVISYQRGGIVRRLEVARPRGDGGWIFDTVDGPGFGFNSALTGFDTTLAAGSDDKFHLAYRDATPFAGGANRLRYTTFLDEEAGWVVEAVSEDTNLGFGGRLALDILNKPAIFHRGNGDNKLHIALGGGGWTDGAVDSVHPAGFGIGATYFDAGRQYIFSYQRQTDVTSGTDTIFIGALGDALTSSGAVITPILTGTNIGDYTSVAQGATTGTTVVSYYDAGNGAVRALAIGRADAPTTGVQPVTLDDGVDVGRFVTSAISPVDDDLYAAYYDSHAQALKMAVWDGVSSPTNHFVDGTKYGTDSAIALTATHVAVAYFDSSSHNLHLARWPIGESPSSPFFSDIVIDSSSSIVGEAVSMTNIGNTLHLVYFDRANEALRGAVVFEDGTVRSNRIYGGQNGVRVGPYCSIAATQGTTTATARLAIAFYVIEDLPENKVLPTLYFGFEDGPPATDSGSYDLDFAPRAATNFEDNIGRFCSVMVDSGNGITISFLDDETLNPAIVNLDSIGTVIYQAIENSLLQVGGFGTSVGINPATGERTVAYYDVTRGGLKLARLSGGNWVVEVVDDTGDTGHTPVLLFDETEGIVRILYYDKTRGALRLASRDAQSEGDWQLLTLLENTMGVHPSALIADDGTLMISFHQLSTGNLLTVGASVPDLPSAAEEHWMLAE